MVAFQNWNAALEKLVSAIDQYRDTLVALEAAFHKPHEHFPNAFSLEETIVNIYERRTLISSKVDELYELNVCLERIRNRSRTQVPINTLPPEVLAHIFSLACGSSCFARPERSVLGHSIRETPQTLLALTRVCSDWRRTTIDSPGLWSHIDIYQGQTASGRVGLGDLQDSDSLSLSPPAPRLHFPSIVPDASLWIDRARNAPLSVHISSDSPKNNVPQDCLRWMFPRLSAATSLSIGPTESAEWLTSILDLWMILVPSGNLRSLTILGPDVFPNSLRLGWTEQSPGMVVFQPLAAPIRSLRLHGAYFDWDSPVYRGLVEIKMSGMGYNTTVTREQMVIILRACPELRILQLVGTSVLEELQASCDPVPLSKLEVLDLARMRSRSLKEIMPIIDPGPGELSVRVDFQDTEEGIQALQSFFSRSNVVRLCLHIFDLSQADLTGHLTLLSNLRVLLLDLGTSLDPSSQEWKLNALVDALGRPNSTICPHLRTLYLIGGEPRVEIVKRVVESCGIERLRILPLYRAKGKEVERWSQPVAQDTKYQEHVDLKELVEDWYDHMW